MPSLGTATLRPQDYAHRPFSRDLLLSISRDLAATGAMKLLDRVQQIPEPEVAMAAISIVFAAFCRRTGMSAQDAHEFGKRLLEPQPHHVKANITMETLRDFAGIRVMGDRRVGL